MTGVKGPPRAADDDRGEDSHSLVNDNNVSGASPGI